MRAAQHGRQCPCRHGRRSPGRRHAARLKSRCPVGCQHSTHERAQFRSIDGNKQRSTLWRIVSCAQAHLFCVQCLDEAVSLRQVVCQALDRLLGRLQRGTVRTPRGGGPARPSARGHAPAALPVAPLQRPGASAPRARRSPAQRRKPQCRARPAAAPAGAGRTAVASTRRPCEPASRSGGTGRPAHACMPRTCNAHACDGRAQAATRAAGAHRASASWGDTLSGNSAMNAL
jgi:hypothetical protein